MMGQINFFYKKKYSDVTNIFSSKNHLNYMKVDQYNSINFIVFRYICKLIYFKKLIMCEIHANTHWCFHVIRTTSFGFYDNILILTVSPPFLDGACGEKTYGLVSLIFFFLHFFLFFSVLEPFLGYFQSSHLIPFLLNLILIHFIDISFILNNQ